MRVKNVSKKIHFLFKFLFYFISNASSKVQERKIARTKIYFNVLLNFFF